MIRSKQTKNCYKPEWKVSGLCGNKIQYLLFGFLVAWPISSWISLLDNTQMTLSSRDSTQIYVRSGAQSTSVRCSQGSCGCFLAIRVKDLSAGWTAAMALRNLSTLRWFRLNDVDVVVASCFIVVQWCCRIQMHQRRRFSQCLGVCEASPKGPMLARPGRGR